MLPPKRGRGGYSRNAEGRGSADARSSVRLNLPFDWVQHGKRRGASRSAIGSERNDSLRGSASISNWAGRLPGIHGEGRHGYPTRSRWDMAGDMHPMTKR